MSLFMRKTKTWIDDFNMDTGTDITAVGDRVKERLAFMNINQETLNHIRDAASILTPYKASIVDQFYKSIMEVDHLKEIINQHSTIARLKKTMTTYLEQFLSANVNKEYVKTRIIVGQVHSRIHLTADHFISAHHLLMQMMTSIVMEKLHNKTNQMTETVLAIQKLAAFDQQLIVEVYMEETFKTFLFGISDTLNYMTQLDTSRQLIAEMDNMSKESHSVSSATEQVSASIHEVANHAVQVAEGTDVAVQSVAQSRHVVNEALDDIQKVGRVYEQVVDQVNQLNDAIEQTQGIVEVIQQITDQTDLLALNASIEAARAGEHGRGFAVVANEVRKLAEHTNEQTQQVSANMESLRQVSQSVTKQISNTETFIEQSVTAAQVADKELNKIVTTIQQINDSISQIAAMSEEQTAAVEEIAQRNTLILDLSDSSEQIAKQTAKIIFELSRQMEAYRNQFFVTNIRLNAKDVIKVAKTDHLLWKWRVYNMLLGLETLEPEQVASYKMCRLGKWYFGDVPAHVKAHPAFQKLDEPHKSVHRNAKLAAERYEAGDLAGAQDAFEHVLQASHVVVSLLTELEKNC